MAYQVITNAQNTGLDSAVFASLEEAEQAIVTAKQVIEGEFAVVPTDKEATTTFEEWNNAGWGW
jgi:hypothetical protein